MTTAERHQAYWIASTPETAYPVLTDGVTVDVAILGGGLVGITAAHLLKEEGAKVAVVEAKRIGSGVTGHTTAKITTAHGLKYHDLLQNHGRERALAYAAANQRALQMMVRTAEERGIDCDMRHARACTYADTAEDRDRVEREVRAALELGLPASFSEEPSSLPYRTWGACCFEDQALFHPLKYLQPLAAAVPGDGSHVFERTRALDVEEGTPCQVETDRGTIRADHVIVATHYPFLDRGFYFARMTPHRSYVLAFRTEDAAPEGMHIATRPEYHSLRTHPTEHGPLIIVVGGHHIPGQGEDEREHYRELERWVREHFHRVSFEYRWSTQDNETADGLPFIGRYAIGSSNLYVATGFAGWGMTQGTAAAMILTDMIMDRPNQWEAAFDPMRFDIPEGAKRAIQIGIEAVKHEVGDRIAEPEAHSLEEVGVGEGKIVEVNGSRVAAHRAEDGTVHTLSPACTHQSCIVRWNPAEKSWDCPCHGSRFDADGTFLHGPAVRDLPGIDVSE